MPVPPYHLTERDNKLAPAYLADPGGRLASDTHRRVLGHLTLPSDGYGWSEPALLARMGPDVGTNIVTVEELQQVLGELESEQLAIRHPGDIWQMSQGGFDLLTGPIANEPGPDQAGAAVPAQIGAATNLSGEGPPGVPPEAQQLAAQDTAEQPPSNPGSQA